MSWENEIAQVINEAKTYKTEKQIQMFFAEVIKDNPFTLSSHSGAFTFQPPELKLTSVCRTTIQKYEEEQESIIGKKVAMLFADGECLAIDFIE